MFDTMSRFSLAVFFRQCGCERLSHDIPRAWARASADVSADAIMIRNPRNAVEIDASLDKVVNVAHQETGKVRRWWFGDSKRSRRIGNLTAEQRYLPICGIWMHGYLVDRIVEEGWHAETDPR
jgi:hypothetical protein